MTETFDPVLQGKVALITGASSGIGRATALRLARHGADVALNFWTLPEGAEQTAEEIRKLGRKALLFRVDVSNQEAVEDMVAKTVQELGRVDVLVTAAVYSDREPFHTADMAGFRKTIDVSLWGAFYTLRAVTKQLLKQNQGGAVVVVSSPHSVVPYPNCMAYNISKAGLDSMARTAAIELIGHQIRVNVFHPGWTDTPGERKFFTDDILQKSGQSLPMGRMATSEEMARGIFFLIDPRNEYMSGTVLNMDGGTNLPWWSKRGTGDF